MKKIFTVFLASVLVVLSFALCACGDDKGGTYYPNSKEMSDNLKKRGYTVEVKTELDGESGTFLHATRGGDFIYFYWLNNGEDCDYFKDYLTTACSHYLMNGILLMEDLVQIKNDEKYGNLVYCGLDVAIKDAGIKVVKTDVKVDVNVKV